MMKLQYGEDKVQVVKCGMDHTLLVCILYSQKYWSLNSSLAQNRA